MAGSQSWIDIYTQVPTPCVVNSQPQPSSTLSSCLVWLVVGLVLGGLTFQKKGTQQ